MLFFLFIRDTERDQNSSQRIDIMADVDVNDGLVCDEFCRLTVNQQTVWM